MKYKYGPIKKQIYYIISLMLSISLLNDIASARTIMTTHIIKKAFSSVVDIEATREGITRSDKNFARYVASRTGVGVIIDPSGIIVTNAHVVNGASSVTVRLRDKRQMSAKLIKIYPKEDLAFLKIVSRKALPVVSIADSKKVDFGNDVFTIGHSKFLKGTVIHGRVINMPGKGFGRLSKEKTIQVFFDVNAYKGDSGSPVFDKDGKMIGLLYGGLQGDGRIGFVVPSNALRPYFRSLRS